MSADQSGAKTRTLSIAFVVLLLTIAAVWLIYSTEPSAPREGASKKTPMLVDVMRVQSDTYRPQISALGNVKAAKRISLMPEVEGKVVAVSDAFVPGNIVKEGEWLLKLDGRDYQFAVDEAKANLVKAQAAYDIEMGEQIRARKDYESLGRNASGANKALMLRKPQKRNVEADLAIARASYERAKLDLARTKITMPFDGQILSQDVNVGARLNTSSQIAAVIGIDRYWIEASIPSKQLKWIARDGNDQTVDVVDRNAWPEGRVRKGQLKQVVAELNAQTRMANAIVEVTDPLQLQDNQLSGNQLGQAPLISGAYVQLSLPGKALSDSFKIPLKYLRKNNTLWVMQNKALDIREAKVAFKDDEFAYVVEGLKDGEQLVKTDLARVRQGAELRLKAEGK